MIWGFGSKVLRILENQAEIQVEHQMLSGVMVIPDWLLEQWGMKAWNRTWKL